jgi:uncharacterized integral membrane protein (TIGR00698 family)
MSTKHQPQFFAGIALCAMIGLLASMLTNQFEWLVRSGLGLLTISIILGMVAGNLPVLKRVVDNFSPGLQFSKQKILRLGIILYGFRLTFQDIGDVGVTGAAIDLTVFISTFSLAVFLGIRYFKLDRDLVVLIGAGSAICGAAAILATEPVVKASNEKVAVAISTVVIFGTVSIFAYPLLYHFCQIYTLDSKFSPQFGIYIGSTVHEVAQVLAAAKSVGGDVADTAVITKMIRVMMLAPFLVALSIYLNLILNAHPKKELANSSFTPPITKIFSAVIPWFVVLFVLVIGVNSTDLLPNSWVQILVSLDNFLLALAMAGLGLTTRFSAIRAAGVRPLLLAMALFVWLVVGGGAINILVTKILQS